MRSLLVAAALVAVALAGCSDEDASIQNVSQGLQGRATETLGDGAQLYAVLGAELPEDVDAGETEGCGSFPADRKPGDGKASVWIYIYGTSNASLLIVTDGAGKFRCEIQEDADLLDDFDGPLTSWTIEAPEAAAIIADNVEGYAQLVDGAMVEMALANTDDGPVWAFAVMSMDGDFAAWAVHADTGVFMTELPPIGTGGTPLPEGGSATGSSLGTIAVWLYQAAEFSVAADGHGMLDMTFESNEPGAMLGLPYGITVITPSGQERTFDVTNGQTVTIESPGQGQYLVQLQPAAAGEASFTVEFCAYTTADCSGSEGALRWL